MGWGILRKARKGQSLGIKVIAMVDRSKCRSQWWTSNEPDLIMDFHYQAAAEKRASGIPNARVADIDHVRQRIREQAEAIEEAEWEREDFDLLDDPSWDAHKS